MIAARLFRWLFRRGCRDRFELSVGSVVAAAAARNLAPVSGAPCRLTAAPIEAATLAAEVRALGPGTSIAEVRGSDVPQLLMLVPDSSAAPAGSTAAAAVTAAWSVAAGVGDFLGLEASGADAAGPPIARPAHAYAKRYGPADGDALAWRLSGRRSFRLAPDGEGAGGGAVVYASVDDATAARIGRAFAEDRGYADAVRSWALAGTPWAAAAGEPPQRVAIGSPREFVLGGLFAPPRVPCGKLVLETRFAEVAANAASSAAGAWIRGSCVLGGEPWSAWYLFPTARVEVAKGLAACLFRGALRRLAGALGVDPVRPSLAAALPPEPSGSARFVGLSAEVRAGTLRVPLDVLVEHDAVASLARAFCDPAELAPRPGGGSRSMLPLVLSLNESLLRRGLPDLARGLVAPTAGGELFSFAAFLDLLPDRDAALLLQNHLSRTLGGRSLRALFGYRAAAAGARGAVVSPVLVDEERLLRLLPQAGREAWERDRGDDARAGSFADFLALNREVLAGAWRAARTRSLLLSPRALFLLEKAVAPGLRRDALAKIAAMAAAGEPLGGLREMPEPRVQQVLAALPTRSLCLSLLGVPAERAYVEARSSRTRRARLGEDLALLGERFRRGEVEADDVLAAMREVGAAVAAAVAKAAAAKAR